MKNLFKNLMLVAVAAMAFTACTETNEEVNAVAKKTVITGVAVIDTDDTRSGFTHKEGDAYKSAWDGTELIKVFGDNGEEKVVEIDADGKFTAEFDQAPNYITVCSPAEAWTGQYSCSIATEQTPRANSVDPAVHVLQSQSTKVVDGSASILVSPQNACYGKMTIDVADAEIEQVKLDLKGLKYHSSEGSLSYTLNATHTQDNTFWFAIEVPMTVQEFTVTAYCAGDKTLTKTVIIPEGRDLKFEWGHVSTFSVSNLTEEVANVFEPTYLWDKDFIWENGSFKLTDDDYLSAYWRIYLNEADRPGNNSIKEGKYTCAVNNTNPGQGQFCVKIYGAWTDISSIYASNTFAEDTLEVKIVDGQYQILYTHGTISHGYKGLPSDFVLPEGGGNEGGETPDPEEPTIKESYNVTWEYYQNFSTNNTYGHAWNVTSGDGGFSAQITTDSRNSYSTETSFTPGTFLYHAQYADGNYGSGMYFTMRNIEIEGKGYSNYDIDGEMVVTIENGAYTITVDLYNMVNGYRTDKITTLNGTFGNVEQGGGETPDPDPDPGEGGEDDNAIVFSSCTYLENVYGMLKHYKLVSADEQNVVHIFMNSNNSGTATHYIPVGDYTNGTMNNTAQDASYFNMDCDLGNSSITDTMINGEIFANGITTDSNNTMSVTEASNGGHHEIVFVIKGTTFRFSGTIQ